MHVFLIFFCITSQGVLVYNIIVKLFPITKCIHHLQFPHDVEIGPNTKVAELTQRSSKKPQLRLPGHLYGLMRELFPHGEFVVGVENVKKFVQYPENRLCRT